VCYTLYIMIRTQIYLTEELYRDVEALARRQKKTKSQVIRESLEEGLEGKKKTYNAGKILLKIAGKAVKGGEKDLSENIDKYLYEE